MSHFDCPECPALHETNNRLRAEIGRLKEGQDLLQRAFDETHDQVSKERDEALAWAASIVKRTSETDMRYDDVCGLLKWLQQGEFIVEARALLDRLQRAEAMVEVCKENKLRLPFKVREALAAWEEGKA